jgi:hypothetical protein
LQVETAIQFFAEEFKMNLRISQMTTPVIAVMDGITFGGGAGLAAYAHHHPPHHHPPCVFWMHTPPLQNRGSQNKNPTHELQLKP